MSEQIARTPKQVGHALRRRRRSQDLTQKNLGEKTGLRQATISGLEGGEPGTQLRTLFDLITALDLELVIRPRTRASNQEIEELF
jgi:HTH-type transcriptional regulator / antitoxin HipB